MEKEWMEEPVHFETAHINNWFYDFAKEVAKLAEEHGLSYRMYHDVLEEKSHFQQ